jgi:hypothetical protein
MWEQIKSGKNKWNTEKLYEIIVETDRSNKKNKCYDYLPLQDNLSLEKGREFRKKEKIQKEKSSEKK